MNKLVIAVTGASGAIYAKLLLEKLLAPGSPVDKIGLLMSENAKTVWEHELGNREFEKYSEQEKLKFYNARDFNAPFASGSGQYNTMIVAPCSMGTMARIAHGIEAGKLILLDASGKQLFAQAFNAATANRTSSIDMCKLAAGIYYLQLITAGEIQTRKIVKQ